MEDAHRCRWTSTPSPAVCVASVLSSRWFPLSVLFVLFVLPTATTYPLTHHTHSFTPDGIHDRVQQTAPLPATSGRLHQGLLPLRDRDPAVGEGAPRVHPFAAAGDCGVRRPGHEEGRQDRFDGRRRGLLRLSQEQTSSLNWQCHSHLNIGLPYTVAHTHTHTHTQPLHARKKALLRVESPPESQVLAVWTSPSAGNHLPVTSLLASWV
jgi:hypothetical protein